MKKMLAILLTMFILLSCSTIMVQAKTGDVIGSALHTDIVVYINNYAIPSYAVNGQSAIVAEDLRNFGFDVIWDDYSRSLTINRNNNPYIKPMPVEKGYKTGSHFTSILETDISVWAKGKKLTSYAINGYTMIPAEELTMFGTVNWVESERALMIEVDGLERLDWKQPISTGRESNLLGEWYYTAYSSPFDGASTNEILSGFERITITRTGSDTLAICWMDGRVENLTILSPNEAERIEYTKGNVYDFDGRLVKTIRHTYSRYVDEDGREHFDYCQTNAISGEPLMQPGYGGMRIGELMQLIEEVLSW